MGWNNSSHPLLHNDLLIPVSEVKKILIFKVISLINVSFFLQIIFPHLPEKNHTPMVQGAAEHCLQL